MAKSDTRDRMTWKAGDLVIDKRAQPRRRKTEMSAEETMATATQKPTTTQPGPVSVEPSGRWRGVLGFMDEWSADQRMLATPDGGVRSRPLPLPLLVQPTLANGHDGSKLGIGVIDRIWTDGNTVMGEGRFDMDDPIGAQLARKVGLGFIRFVSLDVDDATARQVLVNQQGEIVEDADPADQTLSVGDVFSGWRVMGATLLAHPAFPNAQIALADADGQALTAAAFAEQVGYDPAWGCVKPAGDGWETADCTDPDAVPAGPDGTPYNDSEAPPEDTAPPADAPADQAAAQAPENDQGDAPDGAEVQGGCVCPNPDSDTGYAPCDCADETAVPAGPDGLPLDPAPQHTGMATTSPDDTPPTHAGVALKALDTGRVLLLQRALDEEDPASGMWEFPGGGIEEGEDPQAAAWREFAEETGTALPESAQVVDGWRSPNGVYQGYIATVPAEADLAINTEADGRTVMNPDDPDHDHIEVAAWWALDDLPEMNSLREEARETPWDLLRNAGNQEMAQRHDNTPPADCEPCQAVTITAAATGTLAPGWTPPGEWFQPPHTTGAHSITVDPDTGRVSGYLASWSSCHVGYRDRCVTPPRSATDYSYFNLRPVKTSDGTVYCGLLTMDTGHASLNATAQAALAHYDNTGTQAAVVRVGEDNHGIWAVGAALPFLDHEQRLRLSLASFSGDWREIRGGAELIAALAVNSPGFPLAARKTGADNQPYALVAAGALPAAPPAPDTARTAEVAVTVDTDAVAAKVVEHLENRHHRRERAAAATGTLAALRQDTEARRAASTRRRVTLARDRIAHSLPAARPKDPATPKEDN